jgi:hypothetical protein
MLVEQQPSDEKAAQHKKQVNAVKATRQSGYLTMRGDHEQGRDRA